MRPPRHPDGFRNGPGPAVLAAPRQRSFEDLDQPLYDVTFCALDLETTGGSYKADEIVEIGAVKSRGGEILGTFDTLVSPSAHIPVEIQLLTGIRPAMVESAPPLPAVLPSLVEFMRGTVLVAHNARFDFSFLDAACTRLDYPDLRLDLVCTAKLARRLIRQDVPNVRLHTLAAFFRTPHTPSHRAFPDAAACLEVLHALLERASAYGVTTLADLLELQRPRSNPHFEKVRLARNVPRGRGVYLFRNARREIVYVGKATDLRSRVRSYFTTDDRKRIGDLRAEIASVEWIQCATDVEAEALEARLIERHAPRHNRRGVRRRAPVYLKLTRERHPRLSVVTATPPDGSAYIGPFPSRARAKSAADTLSGLFGMRTCTGSLRTPREPCSLYDLGSCTGPCTGRPDDVSAHDESIEAFRTDVAGGLATARATLAAKLTRLAGQGRFEEAASHRDAFSDVVRTVDRARTLAALAAAGRVVLDTPEGRVTIDSGRVVPSREAPGVLFGDQTWNAPPTCEGAALAADGLEERRVVASWISRAKDVRLLSSEAALAMPWPRPVPIERLDLE